MPSADCERSSLWIWGILTMEAVAMMPMPRPFERARLRHGRDVGSTSRISVL